MFSMKQQQQQQLHEQSSSMMMTMMMSHNSTMSFEEEQQQQQTLLPSTEASSRVDAARALLSLTPMMNTNKQQQPAAAAPPLGTVFSSRTKQCYLPVLSGLDQHHQHELSPKTVVQTSSTEMFPNLPNIPHSTVTSSCESSMDGAALHQQIHYPTTATLSSRSQPPPPEEYVMNHGIRFYAGSVSLALADDEEALSPLHCFMRKYCVEAFSATAEDVYATSTPRKSHGRNVVVGQVGIQCVHCKHRAYEQRQERSVCFPSSIKNIYHSMETWQRRHSTVCQDIPAWAKRVMTDLMGQSRSGAGGRRQYWETSAKRLGMQDTPMGICFQRTPGVVVLPLEEVIPASYGALEGQVPPSRAVVFEDDRKLVTDYLFTLLDQMETCYFSEPDRVGGRSKVKNCSIGYPGLQCHHCAGKAGFGRYFPASFQALNSANSDRNIFNHLVKCRRCPDQVKELLLRYLDEQKNAKNRRGLRKVFFQRVWQRMHDPAPPVVAVAEQEVQV